MPKTETAIDSPSAVALERRKTRRVRFRTAIVANIGFAPGLIVDIGAGGARVRHFAVMSKKSSLRISFTCAGANFATRAEVLRSKLVGLNDGLNGAPTYETRLQFRSLTPDQQRVLDFIIESIANAELRRGPEPVETIN